MPLLSASLDTYLLTALLVTAPWIYFTGRARHHPAPNASVIRPYISIALLLHTLYILHGIIVTPPPNIFLNLDIPLNTSTDQIRAILAKYSGIDLSNGDVFPKPLELLLKRLSLFEHRTLYVRFGQHVLQTCDYCTTFEEFALFALPQPLLSYIYEMAFLGLVTIHGSHRERWRTIAVCAVVAAAVGEAYWISTVSIRVPRRGEPNKVTMWHDILYLGRQILFLVLPVFVHILPGSLTSASNPILALPTTIKMAERALTRLHLVKYAQGAIARTPALREQADKWWIEEREEGEWVRGDGEVRRIAERDGFGFGPFEEGGEQGKLMVNAENAVDGLLRDGLVVNVS